MYWQLFIKKTPKSFKTIQKVTLNLIWLNCLLMLQFYW